MEDTLNSSVQDFTANQMQLELKLESQFQRGANWFFWIAGTSIINSIIILTGGQWHLVIGLGITQIFDEVAIHLHAGTGAEPLKIVALVLDFFVAGMFVVFGLLAKRRLNWAFIVGMLLYTADGLIFILPPADFLSIGFHVLALWGVMSGFKANRALQPIKT